MKKSFTLVECILVLVIVIIIMAAFMPVFSKAKERNLDREASVYLKMLQQAEKTRKLESGTYYGDQSDTATINSNLRIMLPTIASNWNYTVKSTGCVQAVRNGGDARSWNLIITNNAAPASGLCP
ncbi:MAG: hypothetical protein NTZ92_05665 [Candidatus Omnitrophica bacterium]|nr:hypothetical protein [Candidatus Omnitrophota bacterium]